MPVDHAKSIILILKKKYHGHASLGESQTEISLATAVFLQWPDFSVDRLQKDAGPDFSFFEFQFVSTPVSAFSKLFSKRKVHLSFTKVIDQNQVQYKYHIYQSQNEMKIFENINFIYMNERRKKWRENRKLTTCFWVF